MSKGRWSAETKARHQTQPRAERGVWGVPTVALEPWKNSRTEAQAKAKAELDRARAGAVAALAKKSRADAKARGAARYIGAGCSRHASGERFTVSGICVLCAAEYQAARRGKPQQFGKLRGDGGKTAWHERRGYMRHLRPYRNKDDGTFVSTGATELLITEDDE